MEIRKAVVEGKLYEVISPDEYFRRASFNEEGLLSNVAIEDSGYIYPVSTDISRTTPYARPTIGMIQYRNTENMTGYEAEDKIVNLSNAANTIELIERQNKLRQDELAILTANQKKVFAAICREDDSPALLMAKECLNSKNIDPDNYKGRFDSTCDYSNLMRLLNNPDNHTLSIQKLHDIGEKFDIDFVITARDKKDAPNPMNEVFEREI